MFRRSVLPYFLLAALTLALFWSLGHTVLRGFVLDLGSIYLPTPLHIAFLAVWTFFGTTAAVLLSIGLARLPLDPDASASDRKWIVYGGLIAFLLPLSIRLLVLHDAPLADDESSYRFMAELISQGRLTGDSHELKLFFDRGQMINDGRVYAQYFVGWPALMVPGVWLGWTGWVNPLLSALTVPALFLLLRRFVGSGWSRLGTVLFLSSPLWTIGAATDLSHTSCLAALMWTGYFFYRGRDDSSPRWDAALATAFSVAFFIRPQSALPLALPFLVAWAVDRRRSGKLSGARILAFVGPALVFAALFLAVNQAQTGSPFKPAYQRAMEYAAENDFRFASDAQTWDVEVSNLRTDRSWIEGLGHVAVGLFRLSHALFGWPWWWLALIAAGDRPEARLWWASLIVGIAPHLLISDAGIDSFGPVHYSEIGWPALVLTVIGLRQISERLRPLGSHWTAWPAAAVVALTLCALVGYTPVRLNALARVADNINLPRDTVYQAGLGHAVVFSPWPFAPNCLSRPTQHHVRFRPQNDPALNRSVLWVNHLSIEQNRQLMAHFPDRRGYVLAWTQDCEVRLFPLESLRPGQVPDGRLKKE